jgi:tetratricopeptide (TPR) repeat protein
LKERFALPDARGCVVLRVSGAAARGGIKQGDLLIKMDEIPITSGLQFTFLFENDGEFEGRFTALRSGRADPIEFNVRLSAPGPAPRETEDAFFYYLRAKGYVGTRLEDGIADYTRAIELAPDFDLAYLNRGHLYMDQGDWDAAERDYNKAIELSPEVSETYRLLAFIKTQTEPTAAMDLLTEAMRLDECSSLPRFTRYNVDCAMDTIGMSQLQAEHVGISNAIAGAHASIEYYPHYPAAYFQLAILFDYLGQTEEARTYAEQFLNFPDLDRNLYDLEEARRIARGR